eukprot:3328100-Amphidinium_carterae.2
MVPSKNSQCPLSKMSKQRKGQKHSPVEIPGLTTFEVSHMFTRGYSTTTFAPGSSLTSSSSLATGLS